MRRYWLEEADSAFFILCYTLVEFYRKTALKRVSSSNW